ncbi:MAG TPA: multidrug efflux RND transporter permease subunit [Candidatus Binatia bacterium]|nr:multidrug efflux RND transporter permease subunit [Candidatus Binatia bacterium]
MAKFFVNRPVVAMVIAILMVMVGIAALVQLPIAQFPNIAPPQIQLWATYVGADALTLEQSVATPVEQQMSGVDNMSYMFSINSNNGQTRMTVSFDVGTNPNTDQILMQMRYAQAESQLPVEVRNYGVMLRKTVSAPLAIFSIYSPKGTHDALFLTNYAYININDPMTRVPGVGQVNVFGAGQYAMRFWVRPDTLAKLNITVSEIIDALTKQNAVNPAGQIGAEPVPPGQVYTYTVRTRGRLTSVEEFGNIIVRANPDGSIVRMKDVARVELGSQTYNIKGRVNGESGAIIVIYQTPGSNALDTVNRAKALLEELKTRFPADMDYRVSLDTTLAVTEGIKDIVKTLFAAIVLVTLVVFLFLQGWRATVIPLLAVPVSLVGTFVVFPLLGFSINTLSLFGLVLAIGLVVDDAIVVVEAVERHIEEGLSPRNATLKAMEEVSGPVIAIALILAAVFVPAAFIPGITGGLYQQFAVTTAVSVVLSAFNALTLSPALSALLLRPRKQVRGPVGAFFRWFNRGFGRITEGYVNWCAYLIRKAGFSMLLLGAFAALAGWFGSRLPTSFLPQEDQGYFFLNVQLPVAASLQRTDEVCKQIEAILKETPGVQTFNTVVGFSLLSFSNTTYNANFFTMLEPWGKRAEQGLSADVIMRRLNQRLAGLQQAQAFAFAPPAIPGVGTSGGITFMLEDRSGQGIDFLAQHTNKFLEVARARPEFASLTTTFLPNVPQIFADVDHDKVLKQGVDLGAVYRTLQAFMGGAFVNYFNLFGRIWQVYVQAEGGYRTAPENVGQFRVRNAEGQAVPLSSLVSMKTMSGPEFTLRFNGYRAAQINGAVAPGYSTGQAMAALEQVFAETMPSEMGYDYMGMSFQEKMAMKGVPASVIFGLSFLVVFLILAAQYESWTLPFSVLLGTPIAVFGAFAVLWLRAFENNVYTQIGLIMLIGLAAKNAILIVEFAKRESERGKSRMEAALTGARLRLRPILMTAFAFILGAVPLAIAAGAGAKSRQILGTTVIGGMTAASLLAIFFIPASFYVVERLFHRKEASSTPQEIEPPVARVAD